MKVLEFFGEPLLYAGQEAFIINMYKNFTNKDIKYTICTPFICINKQLEEIVNKRGDKIIAYNYEFKSKLRKYYTKKAAKDILKNNNFDIIHIHTGSVFTLINVAKLAKKYGVKKIITHSHAGGNINLKYKLIKRYSDKRIKKFVDVYLACSKLAAEFKYPSEIIANNNYSVINNGIDTARYKFNAETRKKYRKDFNISDNSLCLCNVGRFAEQKNHKFIVEIVKSLKEKNVDYKFILVGSGELKPLIVQQLTELNVLENIILLENRNDIAEIMMAADVFVLPSLYEGLAVTSIESQASGLPTLCSNTITNETELTDIIKFIPIENANLWCDEIINMSKLAVKRELYAEKIKAVGYDAKTSAKILEDLYTNTTK